MLYTVEEVAKLLGLHVRTVRNYLKEGKLKAVRIGKQYRIAQSDLAALTGQPPAAFDREPVRRQRHIEVSSIVEIDAISPPTVDRLAAMLMGAAQGRPRDSQPLEYKVIYDAERARLKIFFSSGMDTNVSLFKLIQTVLES